MPYDKKCEELARYFLPLDTDEEVVRGLAEAIQDLIENELGRRYCHKCGGTFNAALIENGVCEACRG